MTLKPTTLLLAVLLFSCTQEEVIVKEYARVSEVVVEPRSIGATFSGRITKPGNEPVIQHGFEWGLGSPGGELMGLVDRVNLGTLDGLEFSANVKRGIEKNEEYVVRAFVETEKFRVVGAWTTFKGTKSQAPFVTAIIPSTATWGDTLEIKGINFSFNREIVKVMFSDRPGVVATSTDESIRVVVPVFTDTTRTALTVTVGEESSESVQIFELAPIEIFSISPSSVKSQTLVTVKGKNFLPSGNRVYLSGVAIDLSAYAVNNDREIQFHVPNATPPGAAQIRIVSGPRKRVIEAAFTRISPVVTSLSPTEVFEGETITIKGSNFGEGYSDNSVKIGTNGVTGQITRIAPGEIDLVLPVMASLDLVVTADYVSTVTQNAFTIKKPVVATVTNEVVYPGQEVTISGDYLSAGSSGTMVQIAELEVTPKTSSKNLLTVEMPLVREFESPVVVTAFGNASNTDMSVSSPIRTMQLTGPALFSGSAFSIGTSGYIVAVDAEHESDNSQGNVVWKYDQTTDQWTRLEDFPGSRMIPFSFVISEKGYLMNGQGQLAYSELWKFDPATEEWTRLNDCPFVPATVCNVAGQVVALSLYWPQKIWKYDSATDTWTDNGDVPIDVSQYERPTFEMTIGTHFLLGFPGDDTNSHRFYEYTPSTNSWISKGEVSVGDFPFAFDHNGSGYILTDDGKLLRYNFATNTWTTIEEKLNSYLNFGSKPSAFSIGNRRYFGLGYFNHLMYVGSNKENMNFFFELDCERAGF